MAKPIQESLQQVSATQKFINSTLSGQEHLGNLHQLNSLFDRIKKRLEFMGAILEPETATASKPMFPPITHFMGEEIKISPKTTASDLNPSEAAKQAFIGKVDKLFIEISSLDANSILRSYTIPEDILVLRGVAKRAGVKDFDKRTLTVQFIEDIQLAVEVKEEEAAKQKAIDDVQKNKPAEKIITEEDVEKYPRLAVLGLKEGDKFLLFPDGNVSLTEQAAIA